MFLKCEKLISIDFSGFSNSIVTDLNAMFDGCESLESINLSQLRTNNVKNMKGMFYSCYSLTSIDLSNFQTSNVETMSYMFSNCFSLGYINLINFEEASNLKISSMFYDIEKNAVVCIQKSKAPKIYEAAYGESCFAIYCGSEWSKMQNEIDEDTEECIIDCSTKVYKFEYNGKCLQTCPDGTTGYLNKCYSDDELCDSNCKTCIFEAGIPVSSNCATCTSNKYLNLGKCVDQCVNGYYTESSIKICKCDLIKCEKCSKESLNNNNLCITCNTNKGYYPKLNDENNYGDYINCYNGNIDGYYLDNY